MKFIFALFLSFNLFAHAFLPVLGDVFEIKEFFPKSKVEIQNIKEEVINSFINSLDQFFPKENDKKSIQEWDRLIGKTKAYVEMLFSLSIVLPSKELREECQSALIEIQKKMHEKIMHSPELYEKFNQVVNDKDLNKEDKRLLKSILNSLDIMGLGLNEIKREKAIELSSELTELCSIFQSNIMEDESFTLATEEDLRDINSSFVSSLNQDDEGRYILKCDYPTVFSVLSECGSSKIRKLHLNTFLNRAHPENTHILEKIIFKRDELSKLLGFKSFADLQISQTLMKSQSNAEEFLLSLLKNTTSKVNQEFKSLKSSADEDFNFAADGSIFPYDVNYLWSNYFKKKYSIDNTKIAEYFSLDILFEKMIPFLENFYDVNIKCEITNDLWVDGLTTFTIQKNKNTLGHIILDLFPREGKYTHACMCPIIPAYTKKNGTFYPALNVVIANFSSPINEKPSLLTINDVRTLYHELGHAFHEILGRTNYMLTAGTNVEIDFFEMPSQLMEEWLFEKDHLKLISCHYEDHTPLPEELIDSIIESRKDDVASQLQRQIFFSLLSLEYFKDGAVKNTDLIYENLYKFCHPNYVFCPEHHFQASFGHLDGYGATYYSYLWSKVIALDIFENFKKEGLIQSHQIKGFVEEILQKGNSTNMIQAVEHYLNREVKMDSFLKRLSINDIDKND